MMINGYSSLSKLLHWGLAISFIMAYISGEHFLFIIHLLSGLAFSIFILTKAGWLFIADDSANIQKFHFANLKEFISDLVKFKKEEQNHNPLSSIVSILIFVFGFLCVASGIVLLYSKEFIFIGMHELKEVHEFFTNTTLLLIAIHIFGVISDKLVFKHNTYKQMLPSATIKSKRVISGIVLLGIFSSMSYWIYNVFSATPNHAPNELYKKECASCHFAYPKELYSKKSWENIMANLADHYGDSAELDEQTSDSITEHLTSTPQNKKFVSYFGDFEVDGIRYSLAANEKFKRVHRHLPKEQVKPSCNKCHTDSESGAFRLANIREFKKEQNDKNNSNRR